MTEPPLRLPFGVAPVVCPIGRLRRWFPALLLALVLIPLTLRPRHSANVVSRLMTVEALVERGTLAIDRTPMMQIARPVDMVRFNAHFYSDKPPVLAFLAAPIYGVMVILGARFTGSEVQFVMDNLAITWLTAGVASALTLVWFRRLLEAVPIARLLADALTLCLGFGTQVFAYAVTFNNHSVAAGLILGASSLTVLEAPGRRASRSRFWAGLLAALAATIDLPAGGMALAGLALIQTIRRRSVPGWFLLGMIGPLALHVWLQSRVTGTPWPVELYPEAFNYPDSFWIRPEGLWREHGPRWRFGLELLFGPRGWLTVTPALTFGLIGLGLVARRRADPLRPLAWVALTAVAAQLVYYTWLVRRTDFGGDSFGTRHLLAISPLCFFFGVVALARIKGWVVPLLFALALVVGGVYAVVGVNDPWRPIEEVRKTDRRLASVQRLVIYPRSQNLEGPGEPR